MDVGNLPSTTQSSCPPVLVQPWEAAGSKPRNRARQNASKLFAFSSLVRREGFFREFVEPACPDILFDLLIPLVGVILAEPLSKSSELGAVELPDLPFEFLYFCHAPQYLRYKRVRTRPFLSADTFTSRTLRSCFRCIVVVYPTMTTKSWCHGPLRVRGLSPSARRPGSAPLTRFWTHQNGG